MDTRTCPGWRAARPHGPAILLLTLLTSLSAASRADADEARRLLYVAVPGIRNYLEWGGAGLLVFDIDRGHAFVKRIATPLREEGEDPKPEAVKGICASAATGRLYLTTPTRLAAIDLSSEKVLWLKKLEGGCDRMAMAPDGSVLYLPSFEGPHWNVVDARTGGVLAKIAPDSGSHNTVYGHDGTRAYLAGLRSPYLTVADTSTHKALEKVGPFSAPIRPFTVNRAQTLCFVNVNGLIGFEVGDLRTGKVLHRVQVPGFSEGAVKRHGCPSHGIALTPDEKEIWVADAANQRLHVFLNGAMPPTLLQSIALSIDQPGWVTFTLDGRYAYPSTGEVIDARAKKIVALLKDEEGHAVQSEKLLEIDWAGDKPVRASDQFGVGRAAP